jgi:hypothetical protein
MERLVSKRILYGERRAFRTRSSIVSTDVQMNVFAEPELEGVEKQSEYVETPLVFNRTLVAILKLRKLEG